MAGNSVSTAGIRVAVERSFLLPNGAQTATDVIMTPDLDYEASPNSWAASYARIGRGFTEEELLFRAKWGWAAHDAAMRAAFEASFGGSP